jgi:transposase
VARVEAAWTASEKKSLHAAERDTEANRIRREQYLARIRETPPEKLIFLDESGVSTQMTRRFARGLKGARVHEGAPEGNWKILTILGAMGIGGMIATMTVEAATDTEIFLAYLDEVLCPKLHPGDLVVMDNLSSHKVQGVRERIQAMGADLLYLPPYSPDLNPIEKSLVQAQNTAPFGQSENTRSTRPGHHRTSPKHHTRQRSSLVPTQR